MPRYPPTILVWPLRSIADDSTVRGHSHHRHYPCARGAFRSVSTRRAGGGCNQGRASGGARSEPGGWHRPRAQSPQHGDVLSDPRIEQTVDHARPKERRGSRDPEEAGRPLRRGGGELPARCIRGAGARLRGDGEDQPASHLLLDLGLRAGRRAARANCVRPCHPGHLGHHGLDWHRGRQPDQDRRAGDRLRDRHDGRLCPCERPVSARAHRQGAAYRPRHARGCDDDAGIAPDRLFPQRHRAETARQQAAFAANSAYYAKEGMVMIGASNIHQQARFWRAVERPDMIKTDNESRLDDRAREAAIIADIMKTKTADEWESYFQARHVPAARVRTMAEAVADPHFKDRRVFHHFEDIPGIDGPVRVPLAAFKFAHGGPSIDHPPHEMGEDTDSVLAEHGYSANEIAGFRRDRVA